jgi:hypothetical protein
MIKEYFKKKSEQEEGVCSFIGCSEHYVCFYKHRAVCSRHYFDLRKIMSVKLRAKYKEKLEKETIFTRGD